MALLINGRSAVHKDSGGVLRTEDLCYTGKHNHIVAYTNIAKSTTAENTAAGVFHNGFSLCHQHSYFSSSQGDEPANAGIHSGTLQGKATFISASSNVFIEGQAAVRNGEHMISNAANTSPGVLCQK